MDCLQSRSEVYTYSDVIILFIKALLGVTIRSRVPHLFERSQLIQDLNKCDSTMYINYNNLLFPNEALYNSEISLHFVASGVTINSVACLKKGAAQWKLKGQLCGSFIKSNNFYS
jgi:hypothetical protein